MNTPSMCVRTGCGVYVLGGNYLLWGDLFYVGDCAVLKFRGVRTYEAFPPEGAIRVPAEETLETQQQPGGGGVIVFPRSAAEKIGGKDAFEDVEIAGGYRDFMRRIGR